MKKGLIFFMILCLAFIPVNPVEAYTPPATVRVGLESKYKEADSVPVSNSALFVGYKMNGLFMSYGVLQSASGFTVRTLDSVCLQAPGYYATYAQAYQAALGYGGAYAPALDAYGQWLVYGVGFASEGAAQSEAAVINGQALAASSQRVALYGGSMLLAVFDNTYAMLQIKDAYGGFIQIGGTPYRGAVEFGRYAGKKITPVNVLTLDEYLYGLVPVEMSEAFHLEALKAQAVATKSYLLSRLGTRAHQGYDLCDLSHCQTYQGTVKENDAAILAVNQTSGRVACYEGAPINAVYFSSSGGVTEDSVNVWVTSLPYLKSVPEINEYEPKIWTRSFSLSEITNLLTAKGIAIGYATGVAITGTAPSGRVSELTIYGTLGNKVLTKEDIRTFFSASAGGSLESRYFVMGNATVLQYPTQAAVTDGSTTLLQNMAGLYAVSDSQVPEPVQTVVGFDGTTAVTYGASTAGTSSAASASGGDVVFSGRGWGHGVGLSQRGAEGMARLGFDYIAILQHYYTGIVVE